VTVGSVRGQQAGQQRQAFRWVDGVVQRDDDVVGQPDEPWAAQLRAGQSRGAGGAGGVGGRQDHPPDVAVTAPRVGGPAQDRGAGRALWTAAAPAVTIGTWLPDTPVGPATCR
jgi:hypothetical protein